MRSWAEHAGVRLLEGAFSALPERAARRMGTWLGEMARRPLGVRRSVVEEQLRGAFPDRAARWRDGIARGCYRHFGGELAALARMSRLRPRALVERTAGTAAAAETMAEAASRGPGALAVTGHLGNWELGGALLAGLDIPVSAVVKRQGNPRVDGRLQGLRRRLGVETIYMAEAGRRVPGALEEGRVVALVADQDAGSRGVFVPFLGRAASTFRGPARLARRHRVPLLFGALVREGGGYRIIARELWRPGEETDRARPGPDTGARARPGPGGTAADGDLHGEEALTRRWSAALEEEVRARPEQYFWFHRRWKTRPERIGDASSG